MGIKPKGVTGAPSGTGKKEVVCEYCKKPKHTKDKCWKLHPSLVPIRFQKKNDSRKTGSVHAATSTDTEVEYASAQLAAMKAEYEKFGKMINQLEGVTSSSNPSGSPATTAFAHSGPEVSEGD
ncbi:PREDICTED: uncharacterized protein LOC109114300 [Nelumbo nucifera]|uniref:Uncharacterized protein LOC109114300 n=1 Tax=Nelumbo nucifera TaxID=4432 RepID=A0A1U8Q2C9_NELNU|nr:PREDICTED: uncharacterized protein LOC109114300 [Nelumbo nucifera]